MVGCGTAHRKRYLSNLGTKIDYLVFSISFGALRTHPTKLDIISRKTVNHPAGMQRLNKQQTTKNQ